MSLGFPLARFADVRARLIMSERFGMDGRQRCYIVTVATSNPVMVRGDVLQFKGSYKERVEAVLQSHLDAVEPGSLVHVEIAGPPGKSIDGLISIDQLVASRKAMACSPLVGTATRYGISRALIHGRHLIGPSPALARLVRTEVSTRPVNSVLELFGGTGIAAKVACVDGHPDRVIVVESDHTKVEFLRSHLPIGLVAVEESDAFVYQIDTAFDLVVADPFYDQVLALLDRRGETIRRHARKFLLACGSVEDVGWNSRVRARLVQLGFVIRRHARYGQVIFECSGR